METIIICETSVNIHQITRRNRPLGSHLHPENCVAYGTDVRTSDLKRKFSVDWEVSSGDGEFVYNTL
jgi:hypothetical protein